MQSGLIPVISDHNYKNYHTHKWLRTAARWCASLIISVAMLSALFVGCSLKKTPYPGIIPVPRSGNYSTQANISYKELKATATITQETPKCCTVIFSSPASLKDMSFVFREEGVDLAYKGLSFTFDPQSLPGGAIANLAVAGINRAMRGEGVSIEYIDNALEITGTMDSGEFKLKLDNENGNLLKLLIPSQELEIEFINFNFLD